MSRPITNNVLLDDGYGGVGIAALGLLDAEAERVVRAAEGAAREMGIEGARPLCMECERFVANNAEYYGDDSGFTAGVVALHYTSLDESECEIDQRIGYWPVVLRDLDPVVKTDRSIEGAVQFAESEREATWEHAQRIAKSEAQDCARMHAESLDAQAAEEADLEAPGL